jgi:hypothetical protein
MRVSNAFSIPYFSYIQCQQLMTWGHILVLFKKKQSSKERAIVAMLMNLTF